MISFSEFSQELVLESIRAGLPHVTTMSHEQTGNLLKGGKVYLTNMTEKTDGMNMKFGHDENGFYTQSTGSGNEKMRSPEDYENRARARSEATGKPLDLTASNAFRDIHSNLASNKALRRHLEREFKRTGKEVAVHGEIFYKKFGRPSGNGNEVKFVGTSYDPSHMGKVGKFVIHSKLPVNSEHDTEHFKNNLSDENINFDDDKILHPKKVIDVSDEERDYNGLNHDLIRSRTTKSNKEAKTLELAKMAAIQKRANDKISSSVNEMKLKPKWGSGTEGAVVHPSERNPDAPRYKITSAEFQKFKAEQDKNNWRGE